MARSATMVVGVTLLASTCAAPLSAPVFTGQRSFPLQRAGTPAAYAVASNDASIVATSTSTGTHRRRPPAAGTTPGLGGTDRFAGPRPAASAQTPPPCRPRHW